MKDRLTLLKILLFVAGFMAMIHHPEERGGALLFGGFAVGVLAALLGLIIATTEEEGPKP